MGGKNGGVEKEGGEKEGKYRGDGKYRRGKVAGIGVKKWAKMGDGKIWEGEVRRGKGRDIKG